VTTSPTVPSLRERTGRAVRAEISAAALKLFSERGFDAVTIEQIAEAAGISRRSFFRLVAAKEDVVLGDLEALGETVRSALEARPPEESAWVALRAAFTSLRGPDYSAEADLAVARIYADAPSLLARHLEKHYRWQELLAPDIERRLGIEPGPTSDPRARAVIAAALACLDAAIDAWRESGGRKDVEQLYDEAVAAVRG
jgi:AcrR family transcriptional regulator